MEDQTRQLQNLRWQIAEMRKNMLTAIDELAARIDSLLPAGPEGQGDDWKEVWEKYEAQK